MENLSEALTKEQARVRKLILQYRDPILGESGAFAVTMMEQSLKNADKATMSGDITEMIKAYNDLKEYTA